MSLLTVDSLVAGMKPSSSFWKTTGTMKAAGLQHSLFYSAGSPGAAVAPSPGLGGAALTSYGGQVPFPAAVASTEIRLVRVTAVQTSAAGQVGVYDRLWHNSGFGVTTLTAQTINSVALPARDNNGSTNGEGVMVAMEVMTTLGSGTPTFTVTYTNSAGAGSKTGTIGPISTTSVAGTWYPMTLQAGDLGVRSIQSITTSATMTSGTIGFVMYRELATIPLPAANFGIDRDAVQLGLPRCYDSTVPFLVCMATGTGTTNILGTLSWAQG